MVLVPPRSPNIWQCSTFNPTDTKNENRRDVNYLSSACSRCKCYLPQPQALILALWVERDSPFPMTERLQIKRTGWHKESGRMEATASTTTHIGSIFFRSGEEDKHIRCSQDKGGRIQSIAHSQPTRSGKEGVDYASEDVLDVNDDHYINSFHSFLKASLLCDVT